MDGILNDGKNASKLLALTAGTLFLLDEQGVSSFAISLFISNLPSETTSAADFFLLNNI